MSSMKTILAVSVGIVLTGLILNELGKGKAGAFFQGLAKSVTQGYGV